MQSNAGMSTTRRRVCFPLFLLSFQTFSIDSQIIRGKSRRRPPIILLVLPLGGVCVCAIVQQPNYKQRRPSTNTHTVSGKQDVAYFFAMLRSTASLESVVLDLSLSLSLCCGADRMGGMLFFFVDFSHLKFHSRSRASSINQSINQSIISDQVLCRRSMLRVTLSTFRFHAATFFSYDRTATCRIKSRLG